MGRYNGLRPCHSVRKWMQWGGLERRAGSKCNRNSNSWFTISARGSSHSVPLSIVKRRYRAQQTSIYLNVAPPAPMPCLSQYKWGFELPLFTWFGVVSNKDTAENYEQEFWEWTVNENKCAGLISKYKAKASMILMSHYALSSLLQLPLQRFMVNILMNAIWRCLICAKLGCCW